MNREATIRESALRLGFSLVGIAKEIPQEDIQFFQNWLNDKKHGSMEWMERGREKRSNIQLLLPEIKSVICVGFSYKTKNEKSQDEDTSLNSWISNYAWGDDYHDLIKNKLEVLIQEIKKLAPEAQFKSYVDTGPVLERSWARAAGLGWIGKNTMLIHPQKGSTFFIGVILTDLDLQKNEMMIDHCGKCQKCIEACPTQALNDYELDATRCISYLTIEHKGEILPELQSKIGNNFYGCDICQEVCPWNKKVSLVDEISFQPRENFFNPKVDFLKTITEENFPSQFKKSPLKRLKWERFSRNLKIVSDNLK